MKSDNRLAMQMLLPIARVKIRDFAFEKSDPRHEGIYPPIVAPNGSGVLTPRAVGARKRRTRWRTLKGEGEGEGDYFEEVPEDEYENATGDSFDRDVDSCGGSVGFDETDLEAPEDVNEILERAVASGGNSVEGEGFIDDEAFQGLFKALYDFEGENPQELSFKEGDWLWISYRHTAGWLVGQRMISKRRKRNNNNLFIGENTIEEDPSNFEEELEIDPNETGLIPENYVEFISHPQTVSASSRRTSIASSRPPSQRLSRSSLSNFSVTSRAPSRPPSERLSVSSRSSRISRSTIDIASKSAPSNRLSNNNSLLVSRES